MSTSIRKKKKPEKRTRALMLRATPAEATTIENAARKQGIDTATWMRMTLLRAAKDRYGGY